MKSGFHGFTLNFRSIHAAGTNLCLFEGKAVFYRETKIGDPADKILLCT